MEKLIKAGKEILAIVALIGVMILAGVAGNLDHDEYIEANSTPITRVP